MEFIHLYNPTCQGSVKGYEHCSLEWDLKAPYVGVTQLQDGIVRWQVAQWLYRPGSSSWRLAVAGRAPQPTVLLPVQALSSEKLWGGHGKSQGRLMALNAIILDGGFSMP